MIDVHIPKAGMSTVEVDIVEILVEPGEAVTADTIVAIVDGEKAQFEVAAGVDGTIAEVLVEDGEECAVGDVIMRIRQAAAA
jgi:pyruvate/2-oxoglutarate dehydrogenase complex dihydrolipoamide acyltransferase (E2) component